MVLAGFGGFGILGGFGLSGGFVRLVSFGPFGGYGHLPGCL